MKLILKHQTNRKVLKVFLILSLSLLSGTISCKKFVILNPPKTELVDASVFTDDRTASAVVSGIYSRMMTSLGFASGQQSSITGLSGGLADEFESYDASFSEFYNNALTANNFRLTSFWNEPYQYIYTANSVIEGLLKSTGVSNSLKNQLIGEAKFIRAFCYFYLANFFGDVPLHLTTDYSSNSVATRASIMEVYAQMVLDLEEAKKLLLADYSFSGDERTRPNLWAASALLARVYLYTEDWIKADEESSTIINHTALFTLNSLDEVFLKNSTESIWQLQPVVDIINTNEGNWFILDEVPPLTQSLRTTFLNSFEAGDNRKVAWVNSVTDGINTWYFPYKYKIKSGGVPLNEYSMVLRLAEQYLIRAEARAKQGKITGANSAESDLNVVRNRAGLPNINATTQTDILQAIEHERMVELFSEWGHRWLDLKRTNRANTILGSIKGSNWQPTDALFPIPQSEILNNPKMVQNPAY